MAGEIATAFVLVRPNSAGFKSMLEGQTKGVGAAVGGSIGKSMGLAIGAAAAVAVTGLGIAAKFAVSFDQSMRNVNSIAQLSEDSLKGLEDQVLDLGRSAGVAPKQLADGLYDVVSSGFKANDAMKILTAGAKASKAGLTSAAVATKGITAVLNAYHLSASQAGKVSDQLFQTVNVGVLSFEELTSQIGDVLPFASSLGVGLDQVGASIATMTKEGINAAETVTRIKAVMTQFLSPSKELAKTFDELGFSSGEAMIKSLGFQGAIDKLAESTDGSKTAMSKLFPDVRALGGVLALTGKNSRTAARDLEAMKGALGATGKAADQQAKSIAQKWSKMTARLQADAIVIGTRIFPVLEFGLSKIDDFVSGVEKTLDKAFGPTLSGKPLTFEQSLTIIWKDVQPALADAASDLWEQIQAGVGAAFQAVVGSEKVEVPLLPGIDAGGGQTVIPFNLKIEPVDQDTKGVLNTWFENNVQPVLDDFNQHGKDEGQTFLQRFAEGAAAEGPKMVKGLIDLFVTGPLQELDGVMRLDAGRIAEGFMTSLGGAFRASGLGIVKDALMAVIGNDLKNALSTFGSLALAGGKNIGSKIWSGIKSGASGLADLAGWVGDRVSALGSAARSAFTAARGVGGRIVAGVISGAASIGGAVTKRLTSIGQALVNYAQVAFGAAATIGANIVSGVLGGLASLAGAIKSKVEGAIGSALSNIDIPGNSPPDKAAAYWIGKPLMVGAAEGVTRNKKLLKTALTTASKEALESAKQNMVSIGSGLGDSISRIIDAQVERATGPLQRRLDAMRAADAAAESNDQRAGLQQQLAAGKNEGETTEQYMARLADARKQLAALDRKAAEQSLEDRIQGISDEAAARKDAVQRSIDDLTAAFNAGLISGKTFSAKLAAIMKANGASFSEAGKLLGFAFAEQFRAQVAGISKQMVEIAKVLGLKGGGAGGAGFDEDITSPLDTIREQRADRVKELRDHQKQLREDQKSHNKSAVERDKRAIARDEKFIRNMDAILRAAKGIQIAQLTIANAADEAALLKALGDLAAAATR